MKRCSVLSFCSGAMLCSIYIIYYINLYIVKISVAIGIIKNRKADYDSTSNKKDCAKTVAVGNAVLAYLNYSKDFVKKL